MGRPRLREETAQLSLYLEAREVPELLGAKGENESTTGYIQQALRGFARLKALAAAGVKEAIVALSLMSALDASAMEVPDVGHGSTQQRFFSAGCEPQSSETIMSVERPDVPHVAGEIPHQPTSTEPADRYVVRVQQEPDRAPSDLSTSAAKTPLVGAASVVTAEPVVTAAPSRRPKPLSISQDPMTKPTPPKKPLFPDRAYAEGRGPRISAARRSLWEQFPELLADLDAGALEFNDLPCDSVSWVEYYEAHLRRLQREALSSEDDPTDVDPTPPTTSPEIAPEEELALWYRTERERIKSTNRSILIANDELKDLQAEYQRRKRALREGPS